MEATAAESNVDNTSGVRENIVKFKIPQVGRSLWWSKAPIIIFEGPAGTGKTRLILEWIHALLNRFSGARALMCRQFRNTMTQTCMYTYSKEVIKPEEEVRFSPTKMAYLYPMRTAKGGKFNGQRAQSEFVVSGLEDPKKVMSSQFDIIFINEGTDITLRQFEYLLTRNRNGVMPWQVVIMDCNPQGPKHWVKQLIDRGWIGTPDNKIQVLKGKLTDNPVYWDPVMKEWTEAGENYVGLKLGALTGVLRARLLEGKWVSEDGVIYDTFDRGVHVVPNFTPPTSWGRVWAFDFGYVNPFVWHNYAVDPDGFMHLHQEIYHTHLLVKDAAAMIKTATFGQPWPTALVCDHDAGDRAILEQELGLPTLPAFKEVETGIQNFRERLEVIYDGKNLLQHDDGKVEDLGRPRIVFMQNSLIHEVDKTLVLASKPTRTIDEFEGYVWDKKAEERQKGDVPRKENDHGMDAARYAAAFEDSLAVIPSEDNYFVYLGLENMVRISSL